VPKLKQNPDDKSKLNLKGYIKGRMVSIGVGSEELAYAINMSPSTLQRRLKNPFEFTVGEIRQIKKKLHMDNEEFYKYIAT